MLDSFRGQRGSLSGQRLPRQDPALTRGGKALSGGSTGVLRELSFGEKI